MGLLMIKGQGGWLSVVAMLAGSLFLLKFLLDSHPGLVPAELPQFPQLHQRYCRRWFEFVSAVQGLCQAWE
jgi:hypothetical protein